MRFLAFLIVLLAATSAFADFTGSDVVITSATGVSLTTGLGNPVGPSFVEFALNGTGYAKFIWFKDNCTSRSDSTQIVRKLVVQLRDYTPPRSIYFPSGPDSARVVPVTASEVILSK